MASDAPTARSKIPFARVAVTRSYLTRPRVRIVAALASAAVVGVTIYAAGGSPVGAAPAGAAGKAKAVPASKVSLDGKKGNPPIWSKGKAAQGEPGQSRTAPKLPKVVVMRFPFGNRVVPARAWLPLASRRLPSLPTLKPAGSVATVGKVPLNGDDGRTAGPTRFDTLKALNICAVVSILTVPRSLKTYDN